MASAALSLAAVVVLYFVGWIAFTFVEPLLSPTVAPLPNSSVPWPPTPTIQLAFVAADGAALRRLAPASLRREAARWLRTALKRDDGGCGFAWRVRAAGVVSASPLVSTNPLTAVVDLRQSSACGCGDPVIGGATGAATAQLAAPSAAGVAACLRNESGTLAALAAALRAEVASPSCGHARALGERRWRPPLRVALTLLEPEPERAAIRAARGARLRALRRRVEAWLEAAWPHEPPPVHSQAVHFASLPGGGAALDARHGVHVLLESHIATLLDCAGSPNCARLPTTVAPAPPLQLLLYAAAERERPLRLLAANGTVLPPRAGLALPGAGAFLLWPDEGEAADDASAAVAAAWAAAAVADVAAQLRVLLGLPASRPAPRPPGESRCGAPSSRPAAAEAPDIFGVAPAEVVAMQLGCLVLAREAADRLAVLADRPPPTDAAVTAHAAAAARHAADASAHAAAGRHAAACAAAAAAQRHAEAAVSHPSNTPLLSEARDPWHAFSVYAPLLLPLIAALTGK